MFFIIKAKLTSCALVVGIWRYCIYNTCFPFCWKLWQYIIITELPFIEEGSISGTIQRMEQQRRVLRLIVSCREVDSFLQRLGSGSISREGEENQSWQQPKWEDSRDGHTLSTNTDEIQSITITIYRKSMTRIWHIGIIIEKIWAIMGRKNVQATSKNTINIARAWMGTISTASSITKHRDSDVTNFKNRRILKVSHSLILKMAYS